MWIWVVSLHELFHTTRSVLGSVQQHSGWEKKPSESGQNMTAVFQKRTQKLPPFQFEPWARFCNFASSQNIYVCSRGGRLDFLSDEDFKIFHRVCSLQFRKELKNVMHSVWHELIWEKDGLGADGLQNNLHLTLRQTIWYWSCRKCNSFQPT